MHAFVQAKVKGTSMTIRTHVQSIYLSVIRIGLSKFYGGFLRYTVRSFMELTLIDALIGIVLLNSEIKNIKCSSYVHPFPILTKKIFLVLIN
jgi:hypothetical protein